MKIPELRKALADHGVNSRTYSIGDDPKDEEQYRLENQRGIWVFSYFERGNMVGEHWFATEDEACHYFLKQLLNDPTTRR
jgi:hypothetical protein